MGFTRTIHCLGFTEEKEGKVYEYHAMNLLEVKQASLEAKKKGLIISHWIAQTKIGRKILGMKKGEYQKNDKEIRTLQLIECPKCKGKGCQICNWSGQTTKAHLKRFQPWQLEQEKT